MAEVSNEAQAEFLNRDTLKAWLKTQPRDVNAAITLRSMLRALPLLAYSAPGARNRAAFRRFAVMTGAAFRAAALAQVLAKNPDRANELRAVGVLEAVKDAVDSNDAYAEEDAEAAAEAYVDALSAADDDADDVADDDVASDADAAWEAVSRDAGFIASGGKASALAIAPLWPKGVPKWGDECWRRLRDALPREGHWPVWFDWYEARLKGGDANEAEELIYASVPEEKWKEGPAAANRWIFDELQKLK